MTKAILSIIMIGVSLSALSQDDAQTCRGSVLPFLPPFEGYYLGDYCKFSEAFFYDFVVDRNSRSIHKEGVYRETWYKRKADNFNHISGLQILKQQSDAIKAAGGEVVPESDGSVFTLTYQNRDFWIFVNANTYSEDLDNYGVISIESVAAQQESGSQDPTPAIGPTGSQGLQEPSAANTVHTIGEHYGGGIVFFVYDNGQHGLIGTIHDHGGIAGFHEYTMARADGIDAGKLNTAIIIASQGRGTNQKYAALICAEHQVFEGNGLVYGDWYLPSLYELNLLYLQKDLFPRFGNDEYYSSTEDGNGMPQTQNFNTGYQSSALYSRELGVHAIRSF